MAESIRWDRPRGSVHNVAHALSLADSGCNVVLLSDAALYVIQNWLALDIEFKARWSDQVFDTGYIPISEESVNYTAWSDLVSQIQAEVRDVSCDLVTELAGIKTALENLQLLGSQQPPIVSVDNALCCNTGGINDLPYYPPSPVPDEPAKDSPKCQRSSTFALMWRDAALELFNQVAILGGAGMGLLAIILAVLALPVSILIAILSLFLVGQTIILLTEAQREELFDGLVSDITCLVFNADSAEEAKASLEAYIDSELEHDVGSRGILKHLFSQELLNQVFDESLEIRPDAISDCSECIPPPACGGTWNFESSDHMALFKAPSQGSLVWSPTGGRTGAGCAIWTVNPGQYQYAYLEWTPCIGCTSKSPASSGFKPWQRLVGNDPNRVRLRVNYTDMTQQESTWTYANDSWTANSVDDIAPGKTVSKVQYVFYQEKTGGSTMYIDDITIDPFNCPE